MTLKWLDELDIEYENKEFEEMKDDENKGPFDKVFDDAMLLFNAINDWRKGNYTEFPKGSIVMIIAAILYFVWPQDLVPDYIPVVGYADDAAVIAFTISQVEVDIQKYKAWKEAQTT